MLHCRNVVERDRSVAQYAALIDSEQYFLNMLHWEFLSFSDNLPPNSGGHPAASTKLHSGASSVVWTVVFGRLALAPQQSMDTNTASTYSALECLVTVSRILSARVH